MKTTKTLLRALPCVMLTLVLGSDGGYADEPKVSFRRDIAPLLVDNCQACHGAEQSEGDYRVDSFDHLVAKADSDQPGIVAGKPTASLLYARISVEDPGRRMPPEQDALAADEITLLRRWIEQGARCDVEDTSTSLVSILAPRTYPDPPRDYPHTMPITALAFGPDGHELLAAGYCEITIWDPSNGKLRRRISQAPERIYALQLCCGGKQVLAGGGIPGRLGQVRRFDLATGKLESVLGTMSDVVLDVAVSPDGRQVAVASADKHVYVYQLDDGRLVQTLSGHWDWVSSIAFSRDGTMLATASRDTTARVFEVGTGKSKTIFSGHRKPVRGVVFAPDNQRVYSSDAQGVLSMWKIADAAKEKDVASGAGELFHLTATDHFVFVSAADRVRQFDQSSNQEIRSFDGQRNGGSSLALDANAERVASGGFDGQVHVWRITDGQSIVEFTAAPGYANGAED